MTGLSHAIFFSLLLTGSFVSAFFSANGISVEETEPEKTLAIIETSEVSAPIEEKIWKSEKKKTEIESRDVVLYLSGENKTETLALEEYIVGVLLAETPSWYDNEALKACAVAARTYTLYKGNSSHPLDADVCDNPSHCQAFYTLSDATLAWNEKSAESAEEKIREAVWETRGEILTCEGKPILAVYHASSYLKTRSAKEVFGSEVAYLTSVDVLHEDGENTTRSQREFTLHEALLILKNAGYLPRDNTSFELFCTKDADGFDGVRVVYDGGEAFIPSVKVRSLFSLKSPSFTVTLTDDKLVFDVFGYGHGVGLSQNGANILAQNGFSYEEILASYYKGAQLSILKNYE